MVMGRQAKILALPKVSLEGQYETLEAVGKGSYGQVFKVIHLASGVQYVRKEAIITKNKDGVEDPSFANEIATLGTLRHPNVVAVKEWGMDEGKVCIVLEYVSGGSLSEIVHELRDKMPERLLRRYVHQMLSGVEYCHSHGVVHRDIKAANVLVTDAGVLKLADFGGAKGGVSLQQAKLLKDTQGMQVTIPWMAPEIYHGRYNSKADIWSLGCTMIEMATGRKPWDEKNFENPWAAANYIGQCDAGPAIPARLSSIAAAFLARCFFRDTALRPTAGELLEDPWFQTTDFVDESISRFGSTSASSSSEAPQGPSVSTAVSLALSLTEVKFNVGGGSLSLTRSTSSLAEEKELETHNWINDLLSTSSGLPSATDGTLTQTGSTPETTGPEKLLTTMDFLTMKTAVDDC